MGLGGGVVEHRYENLNTSPPTYGYVGNWVTVLCSSIGTPKNNKFSIYSNWKIYYFSVLQNLGTLQHNYNELNYWDI